MDMSVMPWAIASQTIPILAIAPMFIVVMNSMGIQGLLPKAAISAYLSFFPVVVGMVKGLRAPDRMQIDLLHTWNASGMQALLSLRFPASLPYLFASLKVAAAGSRMRLGDVTQPDVTRVLGGAKDDADVHHDVDERASRVNPGAQVAAGLLESRGHGAAAFDEDVTCFVVAVVVVPPAPARLKEEPDVVGAGVVLARRDESAIAACLVKPPIVLRALRERPQHPSEESSTPRRCPRVLVERPPAAFGVRRRESRRSGNEGSDLRLREVQSLFEAEDASAEFGFIRAIRVEYDVDLCGDWVGHQGVTCPSCG